MLRGLLRFGFVILAAGLAGGGWWALMNTDAAAQLVGGHYGETGRTLACLGRGMFPCGVVLGYLGVGLGAALLAVLIGQPPGPPATPVDSERVWPAEPAARRRVTGLLVTAAALAALGSGLSIRTQSGIWAVLLWGATLLLPIPALRTIDRTRGTACGNPFPLRWELVTVLLITAFSLVLVAHDMTHWRWAGTPDEADFFGVAKSIATGTSQRPLLGEGGVFNFQPVLSSLYPALFMMVLGVNAFAWKLSSALALAGALPGIYVFARELWNRRTGFIAALLFGSAQLAVGFAHFGYNNVQCYLILGGGLGVLAWARTRRSLFGAYLAGCIAGLGFYTYYTARVVAPLLLLLLWVCDGFPFARKARAQTLALLFGLGLTILPVFSNFGTMMRNMLRLAMSSEQAGTVGAGMARLLEHWFWSLAYGLWFPGPHHFQTNPVVDPIAGTFAVAGLWLCLGGWRRPNGRFLGLAYLLSALLVGATSQHDRPPLTRLLFLAPLTALLAAVAIDQAARAFACGGRTRQRIAQIAAGAVVAAAVVWNVVTLGSTVRYVHHGYGDGTTAELIRLAQRLPPEVRIVFIEPLGMEQRLLGPVMDEYGLQERLVYYRGLAHPTLPMLRDLAPPFTVFTFLPDPQQMTQVEAVLAQRHPQGVWHDSDPGTPWNLRYLDVPAGAPDT